MVLIIYSKVDFLMLSLVSYISGVKLDKINTIAKRTFTGGTTRVAHSTATKLYVM